MGSKRKGGENAKKGAAKMQRNYYSFEKLIEVTRHRGYYTSAAVATAISQNTGQSVKTIDGKIHSGHFSREEMCVIAAYFEMTPKEFCDVFLHGLFDEDGLGHYIAHVDSVYALLHSKPQPQTQREKKQAKTEAILEEIEKL